MKYKLAVCGGTFDHFHEGHAAFLRGALETSERLLLGITSNKYVAEHKPAANLQSYAQRRRSVEAFLQAEAALHRVTIEPIDSAQLPVQWQRQPIEAIIATPDTLAGAQAINAGRPEPLTIVTIDLATAAGHKISSTAIRSGRTDRAGQSYFPAALQARDLILPESERQRFKAPLGRLFRDVTELPKLDHTRLATVGDAVTQACQAAGLRPHLAVVDLFIQRRQVYRSVAELGLVDAAVLTAENPAGQLHASLTAALNKALELLARHRQIVVQVRGEEDLAVLPLVLLLPLDWVVLYGQPHEGIVYVPVTPASKRRATALLKCFV